MERPAEAGPREGWQAMMRFLTVLAVGVAIFVFAQVFFENYDLGPGHESRPVRLMDPGLQMR